ncbi:MAG: hypothetical protein PHH00_04100, partial [Candidatus Nanoarchaeia archaeon]|nr:hypothetical protein [Candidatus Nanoarchaeia archaeon]
ATTSSGSTISSSVIRLNNAASAPTKGVVEMHEVLHALGFPDSSNQNSIMRGSVDLADNTICDVSNIQVDGDIINELNDLYST